MNYGWLVSNRVDECLQRKTAQKIFKSKTEAGPVNSVTTWLSNITFHLLQIWLQTLVAIDSELRLTSFPSFCTPSSEVAALFDSDMSRCPFLRQVVDADLLLCAGFHSEHEVLFLCHIFAQRPMNDRKIEPSDGRCLGQHQLLADSMEISFHNFLM